MKRVYGPDPWSEGSPQHEAEGQSPDYNEKVIELAHDVLNECRALLMMRHRFLDTALWRMEFKPESAEHPLGTDGVRLNFDPMLTLLRYQDNSDESVRDYLHLILHCIFRHPFDDGHVHEQAWSLACDILVESIAMDMAGERFPSELDDVRRSALEKVREAYGTLNTTALYREFCEVLEGESEPAFFNDEFDEVGPYEEMISDSTYAMLMQASVNKILPERGLTISDLYILKDLFVRDAHDGWNGERKRAAKGGGDAPKKGKSNSSDLRKPGEAPDDQDENEDGQGDTRSQESPQDEDSQGERTQDEGSQNEEPRDSEETDEAESNPEGSRPDSSSEPNLDPLQQAELDQAEQEWEQISKQVQMELDSNKLWGSESGDLTQALMMANRSMCDYEDFLRKFSALKEDIKTNEEEFDYIYYTYGFERYGNMPLVEPLEYMETDRVREFVIALDTSQSCSGELIATFVRRTFEIVKDSEVFGSKVNIHIVQCDASVQSDDKIETADELDEWLDGFEVRGLGGTNFVPVFDYVDELIDNDEFEDLCGLIYFTDGLGLYPNRRPEYDTAFVFMNNAPTTVMVPPWAMKVIMTEEEVREL